MQIHVSKTLLFVGTIRKILIILPVNRKADQIGIYQDSILLNKNLDEGSAVFQFYTIDSLGHSSVLKEITAEIYGPNFASSVALKMPRKLVTIEAINITTVNVLLNVVDDKALVYTEILYTSYKNKPEGENVIVKVENEMESVLLENVKLGDDICMQSFFLPDPQSLDAFAGKSYKSQSPVLILPSQGIYNILEGTTDYGWGRAMWPEIPPK